MALVVVSGRDAMRYDAVGGWTRVKNVPVEMFDSASAAVGAKVYFAGGRSSMEVPLNDLVCFDVTKNEWAVLAPMPQPRRGAAAAALGGFIYVSGGERHVGWNHIWGIAERETSGVVQRYDPSLNTWVMLSGHDPRKDHQLVAMAGALYVVGGYGRGGGGPLCSVQRYDPGTNAWAAVDPMHTGRARCAAAALGEALYVAGGRCEGRMVADDRFSSFTESCERYVNGVWEPVAPLPAARSDMKLVNLSGYSSQSLYAIGGYDEQEEEDVDPGSSFVAAPPCWRYDVATDTWLAVAPPGGLFPNIKRWWHWWSLASGSATRYRPEDAAMKVMADGVLVSKQGVELPWDVNLKLGPLLGADPEIMKHAKERREAAGGPGGAAAEGGPAPKRRALSHLRGGYVWNNKK
jgi:hypothetical protein